MLNKYNYFSRINDIIPKLKSIQYVKHSGEYGKFLFPDSSVSAIKYDSGDMIAIFDHKNNSQLSLGFSDNVPDRYKYIPLVDLTHGRFTFIRNLDINSITLSDHLQGDNKITPERLFLAEDDHILQYYTLFSDDVIDYALFNLTCRKTLVDDIKMCYAINMNNIDAFNYIIDTIEKYTI